ncbi:MAG: helix-turn-helix transcriptional regulator [Oscillospiraceae bacterium]|jgi:transcriptional regulator with XRE-family HTH domain|nr:helix-turn-helix transcriptional regulator [Oscillospiraceae bacterium]
MFDKNILAARVYELRKSANLHQSQLGEAAGVGQFTISKIEKAQRAASIEVLYALAVFFNTSIDYLVGLSDDPRRR